MPRKRRAETEAQREARLHQNERRKEDADRAAEDAIDGMIKRSLDRHGP